MRVLLDHCVHKGLAQHIEGHEVAHTSTLGWGNLQNGLLLRTAKESGYDCLVTVDKGFQHQQNIARSGLAVITIQTPDVSLPALLEHLPVLLEAIAIASPGTAISVVEPGID